MKDQSDSADDSEKATLEKGGKKTKKLNWPEKKVEGINNN